MAITPKTGFGSIPPTALAFASGDVLQQIINAAVGSKMGITHLSFSGFQASGAAAASSELFLTYYILRGSIGGTPPVPAAGTYIIQIPTFKQLADAGYELLVADFVCVANNGVPITFEHGHLEATGNQQLVVISGALFDATTTTAVEVNSINTQTVLGYDTSSLVDAKLR